MRGLALFTLGFAVAGTGCSLMTELGGLEGHDGGSPNDAQATGDAGTNVLTNPGFEESGGGCGPGWTSSSGTLVRSTTAHSGASACEVCLQPGDAINVHASPRPVNDPQAGTSYYASAYFMGETPLAPIGVALDVEEYDSANNPTTLAFQGPVPVGSSWQLIAANAAVKQTGASVDYALHLTLDADAGASGCVLLDDTSFSPE